MVVPEPETMSQGEVASSLQSPAAAIDHQRKNNNNNSNHPFSSLGGQSSIYSLTLDEFQHTLSESGKSFGSMNMDEFITSIWTAEENQAINSHNNNNNGNSSINGNGGVAAAADHVAAVSEFNADKGGIARQPSLTRQGSLTLPPPLCRKTVDEVWSEIHNKGRHQESHQPHHHPNDGARNSDSTPRQPTFGEMTLEDFLIKAGVVREPGEGVPPPPQPLSQPQQQYGIYQNNPAGAGPSSVSRTAMGITGTGAGGVPAYQAMSQATAAFGESSSVYPGTRNGIYPPPPPPPPPVCYGGRVVNGGGGYTAAPAPAAPLGLPAPVSPVSSDGICGSQVDNSGSQFGLDMGALRGRKRIINGPVEKVVERRQRRMIKNRESAARSRARKQAYTVELEAELNQLREENAHLKQALAELERKQKQQYFEEMKTKFQTKAFKAKEKLRAFRRNSSCPL